MSLCVMFFSAKSHQRGKVYFEKFYHWGTRPHFLLNMMCSRTIVQGEACAWTTWHVFTTTFTFVSAICSTMERADGNFRVASSW